MVLPPANEKELLTRCVNIAGRTLGDLVKLNSFPAPANTKREKGWIGQFLEHLLGATASNRPMPDFEKLGIELKTIPVTHEGKPRESTYICSIALDQLLGVTWDESLVKRKISKILWIPVEYRRDIPLTDCRVGYPILWSPTTEQEEIIRNDWEELIEMLAMGQLEEINGYMGTYLQVRPKAANSQSLRWGIGQKGDRQLTLPRGFYLRSLFTKKILEENYQNYF